MRLLLLSLAITLFYSCSGSKAESSKSSEDEALARVAHVETPVTKVKTTTAQLSDFEIEIVSNGSVEAKHKAVVPFVVQEHIKSILVKEGDFVKHGQLLGSVEPFSYEKRVASAQNSYKQALVDLEDRLLGYGYKIEDSLEIPKEYFEMARLRSGYNSAQIALEEAEYALKKTYIRSPIDGVVSNLEARLHNPSQSYSKFCDILDMSSVHIVFKLLETELSGVEIGQKVLLFPFALKGEEYEGKVVSINPNIDDKGMVRIVAEIPNKSNKLIDGMNGRVILKKSSAKNIAVPKTAVIYRQNRQVVFVYQDDKAIWTYVETGLENSTHIAITDGLTEGMEVIYDNNINLAHESPVEK